MSVNIVFLAGVVTIAVLCFGSNFVPLRSIHVTNHAFFQWVMCNAILLTAIPWVLTNRHNSLLEPLAMLGGVIWCIGNYLTPFIIERLGLGVGSLLWSTVGMITAWASSIFGILGMHRQDVRWPLLSGFGVVIIIGGGCLLTQVKVKMNDYSEKPLVATIPTQDDEVDEEEGKTSSGTDQQKLLSAEASQVSSNTAAAAATREGIAMCLVTGFLHGIAFNPAQYLVHQNKEFGIRTSNLILSHYAGIAYTSVLLYFLATLHYSTTNSIVKTRALVYFRPVEQAIILPAAVCGILWGVATLAAFVAIESLPLSITYPLISAAPNIISTMWSVFYFKEITEFKDLCYLGAGVGLLMAGLTCICLSN